MRAWATFLGVLCICAGMGFARPGSAQESPADIATARELFREGLKLSRDERWEDARVKLTQSLSLKQTPLTYYTLAVAEKNSGHNVAALEHFTTFIAQPQTPKTEAFVPGARDAVTELEKMVARVTITISPEAISDLEVAIDGEPVPSVALGRTRLVDPRAHEVTAEAPGYLPARDSFNVEAQQETSVSLTLERAPDWSPTGDGPTSDAGDDDTLFYAGVGLLAGGGAIGATGLILGIIGAEEASGAPTSDGPEADAALEKALAGDILMGVGGAAAIAGLVMVILAVSGDDEPPVQAGVRPWFSGESSRASASLLAS